MTARRRPPSIATAIATSQRRARVLAGTQALALVGLVIGGYWLAGSTPPDPIPDGPLPPPAIPDAGVIAARCADYAACKAACKADAHDDACVRLGDLLRRGAGGAPRDRVAARDHYRASCAATGDPLACTRLALITGLLHDLDLAPDWFEPAAAPLGLLGTACNGGARGRLACAALELLGADGAVGRIGRERLCGAVEEAASPARLGCAARVAAAACEDDAAAEACYLAAREGVPTRDAAHGRLEELCRGEDRPACLYAFRRTPPAPLPAQEPARESLLLTACSELESEKAVSIASACLIRALTDYRRGKFIDLACELGSCQASPRARPSTAALAASCKAGHPNGCANAMYARRGEPAAWQAIRAAAAQKVPAIAALPVDEAACRLGSSEACAAAAARATGAERAALQAYAARLAEPFAP